MSRFLGASSRGGIQSSPLSDGTLTMSNGMLEGVASINGIPPVQITTNAITIAANTASLGTLNSGKQDTIDSGNAVAIKSTLGLNLVNNTTDALKIVSTPTQTALNAKQATITTVNAPAIKSTLGLNLVNNTTDASKPVSDATQTALEAKLSISGVVDPLTIKTQNGGVDSPALTLFHTSASTVASYTGIELRVRNTSNYSSGHHEPSVKQVYEYDNGDILGQGRTGNIINRVFYQFMDRTGSFFDTPLPGGTVLHTGPYFNSNGLADFAGGSLTGVNGVSASGTVTAGSVGTSYVTNGSAILRLSGTGPLMLPSKKITTTGGHNDQGKFIGGNPSGPLRPGV